MSVLKRPIGRRVTGVGVGVALLVFGLAGTALAVPTVSGVTPNTGNTNCAVVITGTGFLDFPQAQQDLIFDAPTGGTDLTVAKADWFAVSATEIWAAVPAVANGQSYTVTLKDPTGGTSTGTFLATSGAGGCAPTITSFTPACGAAGTVVTILGTNLLEANDLTGADVSFSPYTADATHTVPDIDDPTTLSVIVPSGAADGPIKVTTDVGSVFSATSFQVPPPDCTEPGGNEHARSITLTLKRHLRARGVVSLTDAADTLTECVAGVPVKIQRRTRSGWRGAGSTTTDDTGAYKLKLKDKPGKYRAKAKRVSLNDGADICLATTSSIARHRH